MRFFLFLVLCIAPLAGAQTIVDVEQELFDQKRFGVQGRLRHVTLEQVTADESVEVVAYTRRGAFPNWKGSLYIFDQTIDGKRVMQHSKIPVPDEAIYYGFILIDGMSNLLLVLPQEVRLIPYLKGVWQFDQSKAYPLNGLTTPWAKSTAVPFQPLQKLKTKNQVWIPTHVGYQTYDLQDGSLIQKEFIPLSPKSFYRSSYDLLPFEMSYWFQNIYWYPKIFPGSLDQKSQVLFSPWMDEIDIVQPDKNHGIDRHFFRIMTEKERDDGTHYLMNEPIDLNGDGRTDFLLNKFQGMGTSFRSKSYYYMTGEDGTIPKKGKLVPFPKKKIAGALVQDITNNGKQDFLIVSSILNVWSMIRALTKKQILLSFDIYLFGDKQKDYNFKNADINREILFDFSLSDFFIDGMLPTLDGDFDGDGFKDVMYATNPRELTFLIQRPHQEQRFDSVPSGLFQISIPRKHRVGDITGDGKSDLVFFSTRAGKNNALKILVNNGLLK